MAKIRIVHANAAAQVTIIEADLITLKPRAGKAGGILDIEFYGNVVVRKSSDVPAYEPPIRTLHQVTVFNADELTVY